MFEVACKLPLEFLHPRKHDTASDHQLAPASEREDMQWQKTRFTFDTTAEAAARFYAEIFSDSGVGAIYRAPSDYPSGKRGDVLMLEFTVAGVCCIGLNGGLRRGADHVTGQLGHSFRQCALCNYLLGMCCRKNGKWKAKI